MSKLKKRSVYLKIITVEVTKSCELNVIRGDSNSDFTGYKLTGPCFELQPNQSCNIKCTPSKPAKPSRSQNRFCEVTINMSPAKTAMNEYSANTNDVIEISHVQEFLIKKFFFDIGVVETETSMHRQFHPHVTVKHPVGGQNTIAVTNCSTQKVRFCFFNPEPVAIEQNNKVKQLPPTKQVLPLARNDDDVTMQQRISEESFVAESDRVWPHLCGLENLGNTCYMNSVLQCLVHTEPLRNMFLYNTTINNKYTTHHKKGSLCDQFGLLTKEMWDGENQVVNPRHLKDTIATITSKFRDSTQEDAQEFLICLLSELHDELKIAKGIEHDDMVSKPKPNDQDNVSELAETWWKTHKKKENSKIFDIFYCQIYKVVTCRNRHKAIQFQAESQLTLHLPVNSQNFNVTNQKRKRSIAHLSSDEEMETDAYSYTQSATKDLQKQKKTEENQYPRGLYYVNTAIDVQLQQYCTVEECLKAFTSTQEISSRYCHDCKSSVYGGTMTTVIQKLGNVVIVHLNRFHETSFGWTKSDLKIHFDDELSIILGPEHAKYDLYAVISHEGSTSTSGHYYAIIKHEDNWFHMNDSFINFIPKSNLINKMSNAYVLFYQRKDT